MNDDDDTPPLKTFASWIQSTVRAAARAAARRLHEAADGPEQTYVTHVEHDLRRMHQNLRRSFEEIEQRLAAVRRECRDYAVQTHVDELKRQVRAEIQFRVAQAGQHEARVLELEHRLAEATLTPEQRSKEEERQKRMLETAQETRDDVLNREE